MTPIESSLGSRMNFVAFLLPLDAITRHVVAGLHVVIVVVLLHDATATTIVHLLAVVATAPPPWIRSQSSTLRVLLPTPGNKTNQAFLLTMRVGVVALVSASLAHSVAAIFVAGAMTGAVLCPNITSLIAIRQWNLSNVLDRPSIMLSRWLRQAQDEADSKAAGEQKQ